MSAIFTILVFTLAPPLLLLFSLLFLTLNFVQTATCKWTFALRLKAFANAYGQLGGNAAREREKFKRDVSWEKNNNTRFARNKITYCA